MSPKQHCVIPKHVKRLIASKRRRESKSIYDGVLDAVFRIIATRERSYFSTRDHLVHRAAVSLCRVRVEKIVATDAFHNDDFCRQVLVYSLRKRLNNFHEVMSEITGWI